MAQSGAPFRNQLLNALSATDLDLLRPDLEAVRLDLRFSMEIANQPIRFAYFPERGLASIVAQSKANRMIEVGLIGREGMTGLSLIVGTAYNGNFQP